MTFYLPVVHSLSLHFVFVILRAPGVTMGDRIGRMYALISGDDLLTGSSFSDCRNGKPLIGAARLEIMSVVPTSCEYEV